jgi:hypothetical protein
MTDTRAICAFCRHWRAVLSGTIGSCPDPSTLPKSANGHLTSYAATCANFERKES